MTNIAATNTMMDKQVIPSITVTIDKMWDAPRPVGTNGNMLSNYQISDETGTSKLTLFSSDPNPLQVGQKVTLQAKPGRNGQMSGVEVSVWNGPQGAKHSIKVSNASCIIPVGQAAPQAQPQYEPMPDEGNYGGYQQQQPAQAPPQAQPPAPAPVNTDGKLQAMCVEWATIYATMKGTLMKSGVPEPEAKEVAMQSPAWAAQYWFGNKSLANPDGK